MNIAEMEAGREMDALVAEKVMGMTLHPHKTHWGERGAKPSCRWRTENEIDYEKYTWRQVSSFRPSADISSAWEVVEKLGDDFLFEISGVYIIDTPEPSYRCWIHKKLIPRDGKVGYVALAPTAPLAICRAALLACGINSRRDEDANDSSG